MKEKMTEPTGTARDFEQVGKEPGRGPFHDTGSSLGHDGQLHAYEVVPRLLPFFVTLVVATLAIQDPVGLGVRHPRAHVAFIDAGGTKLHGLAAGENGIGHYLGNKPPAMPTNLDRAPQNACIELAAPAVDHATGDFRELSVLSGDQKTFQKTRSAIA